MSRPRRYRQIYDGVWQRDPHGVDIACCDCGLVHTFKFRVTDGVPEYMVTRREGMTRVVRKRMGRKARVAD